MPLPQTPDITFLNVSFDEGVITMQYFEEADVTRTSRKQHLITVPIELVTDEYNDVFEALRDLWQAAEVVHRNPPDRLRQ